MSLHTFYNPELVEQLNACGITTGRLVRSGAPAQSFVLEGRRAPRRGQTPVTNVRAVQNNVTITGPLQPARPQAATPPSNPQSSLELVEECARLQRDNQRLASEIAHLRGEITKMARAPLAQPPEHPLDDAVVRFSLLELDR